MATIRVPALYLSLHCSGFPSHPERSQDTTTLQSSKLLPTVEKSNVHVRNSGERAKLKLQLEVEHIWSEMWNFLLAEVKKGLFVTKLPGRRMSSEKEDLQYVKTFIEDI